MQKILDENIVCAGIVLYNPDEERLTKNIESILPQVSWLVLVDNASNNVESILNKWGQNPKIKIIKNNQNEGIAKALNQMCDIAISKEYKWILTLDQDSVCPRNLIDKLVKYIEFSNIGIICPRFKLNINGHVLKKTTTEFEYVDFCITSASLTKLEAWEKSGKFDEWMFIDCVDYDFCIKLKNIGYKIIRINDIVINHEVGHAEIKYLPFKIKIILYNHNNLRNYYIVRNTLYLVRKYSNDKIVYKWLPRLVYWELCKIVFEKNKKDTFLSILRGINDGIFTKNIVKKG